MEVKYTECDRTALPDDMENDVDSIKDFDATEAERNVAKLFGYKD